MFLVLSLGGIFGLTHENTSLVGFKHALLFKERLEPPSSPVQTHSHVFNRDSKEVGNLSMPELHDVGEDENRP